MNLKEKAKAKVKELDARMAELDAKYKAETDPDKQTEIAKEIYAVMQQTNKYLRMAGASENETYVD